MKSIEIIKTDNLAPIISWFFDDIGSHAESLKKQWINNFSNRQPMSLPDLNEVMINTVFIEFLKWKEAKATMDSVTKKGPHLVMFQTQKRLKEVLGIVRIKPLLRLYDKSDREFRLYMQKRFVIDLFEKGELYAFNNKGDISKGFVNFLKNRVSDETIKEIKSTVKNKKPVLAFDHIMTLTKSASIMQFITVGTKYVFPLINQVTYMLHYKIGLNFICAITEQNILSEAIFGLDYIHRQSFPYDQKFFIVAQNDNFENYQTKTKHKTWLMLIECASGASSSSLVIENNIGKQVINYGKGRP